MILSSGSMQVTGRFGFSTGNSWYEDMLDTFEN
jgi:hypothetical protein